MSWLLLPPTLVPCPPNLMAIRRPSISSPQWLFQDFLYLSEPGKESRFLQVKLRPEPYIQPPGSADLSQPPCAQWGDIVGQIDYELSDKVVTITNWEVNWRDEYPIRLGVNYLANCLYRSSLGYVLLVAGAEVYANNGEPIPVAGRDPNAFWVSENFFPPTNKPDDYLIR
jgi:hypothetical protein